MLASTIQNLFAWVPRNLIFVHHW